jgi:hypothetical protein
MCIGIPDKATERRVVFCFVEVEVESEGGSRGSSLSILLSLTAGMTGKRNVAADSNL